MTDLRPDLGPALSVFGLPATATVPGGQPVATTAIWLPSVSVESAGVFVSTDRPQAVLALPRADVSSIPRGTIIQVAEMEGGPVLAWVVEGVDDSRPDEIRLIVLPS